VANALLMLSRDINAKIFFYTLHGDSVVVLSVAFYYLTRFTTQPDYRPNRKALAALGLTLACLLVFSATAGFRHLLFQPGPDRGIFLIPGFAPQLACWLLFIALPYAVFALSSYLLIRALPLLPKIDKLRATSYLLGVTLVGGTGALYYFWGLTPVRGFDPTPTALGVAGALMMCSTYYFRGNWAELFSIGGDIKYLDVKFFTYRLVVVIVIPAGFVFTTMAFLNGQAVTAAALVLMLVTIIVGFILMQGALGSEHKDKVFTYLFSAMSVLFAFILVYVIGYRNELYKMPWAFLLPVVAIHGLGPAVGLAGILIFFLALALASHLSGSMSLTINAELWIRFFLADTCLTLIMCFMELARAKYMRLLATAEAKLRRHRDSLEDVVAQRTLDLKRTVEQLKVEAERRQISQAALLVAKEAAETANQVKTEFLANMSHELRTPLTHILGFSDLLAEGGAGPLNDQQKEYLGYVMTGSRHLHGLVDDLLDMAGLEANRMELALRPASLREIIDSVLVYHAASASKAGVDLQATFHQQPFNAWLDARRVRRIVNILVANAIKFSPGGWVRVDAWGRSERALGAGLSRDGAWIEIAVSDNGIGLRPQDLERIFEPFVQVDSSTSRSFDGTGLGLALARRLVEKHGGRLWAESDGLGRGSKFSLVLPWVTSPLATGQ
jgi:signal transduction histidine kinase